MKLQKGLLDWNMRMGASSHSEWMITLKKELARHL